MNNPTMAWTDPVSVAAVGAASRARTLAGTLSYAVRSDAVVAQLGRFAVVGGSSNVLYGLLFVAMTQFGTVLANLVGVVVSTVLATELHRRLTFHAESRVGWFTAQWEGGGLALVGLATSYAALAVLHMTVASPNWMLSVGVVVASSIAGGLVRFLAMRGLF